MSITNNMGILSTNIQDLAKNLDVLAEKISVVLIPQVPAAVLNKVVDETTQSTPLGQDIQRQAQIVYDLNCKCSELISRIDIV